ncbi:MAG: hypothetical protein KDI39_13115, partial [Pseudomonadales bacterium]|nr:hypothetical protein [Pseudomonadales bacterium]
YQAVAGTSLTLTEAITAGSSVLSQYQSEISCTNANTASSTVLPSGTTQPFSLVPQDGDAITCTITNTPLPRLRVNKVVGSIADANDRFTTQIRTGGVSGTVVSSTTNNAVTGGGVLTTGGVATYNATGKYQATVGTTYSFTEILSAGTSDISQYTNSFSCTNSYAGSTTAMPTGAYPYEVTPQLGDDISCTLTNNVVAPIIRVNKTVIALADPNDRFITQIRTGGVSGTVVSNPNSSATVGGGVFTTGGAGTYPTLGVYAATVGTTYSLTEVFAAGTSGFSQYTTSVSCSNARTSGPVTVLPSGSTAPFNLTPKAGDDISCTLTNDIIQPKIRVHKTVSSLVDANDRFTTEIRTGGVSGTVVSGTTASSTLGGGVLTTGGIATYNATGIYQGLAGTTYSLTESIAAGTSNLAQYTTSIVCTNTRPNGPTTVLPTGTTQPFNIAAQAGDDISCTLSNSIRQPQIRVHKTVVSLVDANDRFVTQIRTGGVSGTVVSDLTASTTTGGGVLTTGGAATYNALGTYQGALATTYTITEVLSAGTSALNQYNTSISCTNTFATSSTVLPTGTAQPFNIAVQAGDDISCTLSNSIKQPLLRINKVVDGLRNNDDRFTTQIRTGGVSGAVVSDLSNSLTTGGGVLTTGASAYYQTTGSYQATIGTTYTFTEILSAGSSTLGQYNTSISCTNARSGASTVLPSGSSAPFNVMPAAGDDITCIFTNIGGAVITGRVFYDNGKNAATPHNGVQEVDELGIGNALVRLTDCGSTVYQTTTSDGAGDYTLSIPNTLGAGVSLCVEEYQQPALLVSVSGVAGTTGGSYSLAQDRTQFTLSAATNYTGVNFGDVAQSQLTGTGNQTIAAGTTASYGHQFIAGTEGTVTFSTAQAPTPNLVWTSLVYLDNNCNALLDGGDTQITAPIAVVADQVLCLVQKVQSPSTAANGSQDVSTLSASFVYAAPSAIT